MCDEDETPSSKFSQEWRQCMRFKHLHIYMFSLRTSRSSPMVVGLALCVYLCVCMFVSREVTRLSDTVSAQFATRPDYKEAV